MKNDSIGVLHYWVEEAITASVLFGITLALLGLISWQMLLVVVAASIGIWLISATTAALVERDSPPRVLVRRRELNHERDLPHLRMRG